MNRRRDLTDGPHDRGAAPARDSGSLSRRLAQLDPGQQGLESRNIGRREIGGSDRGDDLSPAPIAEPRRQLRPAPAFEAGGRGDSEFSPHALDVVESPRSPIHGQVLFWIAALFVSVAAWAYFGRMATYSTSTGKIQVTGRTKVLEALAKGQVRKILVHDGDAVARDAVLVELDPTEAAAARTIVFNSLTDRRAERERETVAVSAAHADKIDPAVKIQWTANIPANVRTREEGVLKAQLTQLASTLTTLEGQRAARVAERDKDDKSIVAQQALIAVTQENLTMIQSLMDKGYNSRAQFLDMSAQLENQKVALSAFEGERAEAAQAIALIDTEIAKTRQVFATTNTQAAVEAEQAIVDLTQQLTRADQTLANMTLRSPVTGTIHASAVTTIGQVVKAGQQLMQIVPAGSPLEVLTYVDNTNVGFIHVGQPATIKLTSFNYGTYGSIDGTVTSIARDALPLEGKDTVQSASLDGEYRSTSLAQKTGTLQFPVTIRTRQTSIKADGKDVPLVSGMTVSVELETEKLRGVDYVITPILELFSTAAHEK